MTDVMVVEDGQVVSMDYVLHVDGELIDASEKGAPLQFIQGEGLIITGLEDALYGMKIGDNKKVVVTPEDAYGEINEDYFMDLSRDEFPEDIPLEPGVELQLRNEEGEMMPARIDSLDGDLVRLDFNHPLAGKELHFDVTIVGLRVATEEEMEHGHVHED